jgi:hypothetical protein
MMETLRAANLTLAFGLEIAMLVALGYAGFAATDIQWLRYLLLIGWPALAIVLWAIWAAPKSGRRLPAPALLVFKAAMFGVTTFLLYAAGANAAALLFGALAALHLVLAVLFRQI